MYNELQRKKYSCARFGVAVNIIEIRLENKNIDKSQIRLKSNRLNYSSLLPRQHELRFSGGRALVRLTVSLQMHASFSAVFSIRSQCWTAMWKASWTLFALRADVSMQQAMEFSLHHVSNSSSETSRCVAGMSD